MDIAAWRSRRALVLSFALLASLNAHLARANGVSTPITANQPVTGSISGDGVDSYSFNATTGKSFAVTIAETGAHSATFVPVVHLLGPGNFDEGEGHLLGETMVEKHPAEGQWTISVSAMAGPKQTGGSYRVTLIEAPFSAGGTLTSTPASGTNVRDQVNVHTFTGTAGHKQTIDLEATGGEGFTPRALVFSPSGELVGDMTCAGCEDAAELAASGTYTVVVTKGDYNDVSGTYSIAIKDAN